MVTVADLLAFARAAIAEWRDARLADLLYSRGSMALLLLIGLVGISASVLLVRSLLGRGSVRGRIALPALVPAMRESPIAFVRHIPLILFFAGLAFFTIALADPFTSLAHQEVSFPGRRIGLLIDASSSMMDGFAAPQLAKGAPNGARFFTAVGAARLFVNTRKKGKYRDLIALLEFGDESYVVTPFTNDYDNMLLSISLIGEPNEFYHFPDQGTTIATAIDQAVDLFTAFEYLNASGNLLVILSDGEDVKIDGPKLNNKTVDEILSGATKAKIPVYFLRIAQDFDLGKSNSDYIWKPVVERTGGRFYAARDEASILSAIEEIDKRAVGRVAVRQYSTEQTRFSSYALAAAVLWSLALLLKLTVPYLRKFP